MQEFPCSSCNSRAERSLRSLNRVNLCLNNHPVDHDYQTQIQTASSILRVVLKRDPPCFSIAKLTNYAISSLPVSKLIVPFVMELVVTTINARLLDGINFFRR